MLNFKNLSEKQALTYTIIGAIVLCLIPMGLLMYLQHESGHGLFANLVDNPANLTALVAQKQEEKNKIDVILKKEPGLLEELRGLEEEYDRYKKALPEADNLEDIYKLIGDTLNASRIIVKSGRPITHEVKAPPKPAPVTAPVEGAPAVPAAPPAPKSFPVNYIETIWSFEGKYQDILNGLHKIEDVNFERFVLISDLRLTPAPDPKDETNMEYMSGEVTFVCFYYIKEQGEVSK